MYEDKTLVIAEGIILCCRCPHCSIYVSSSHLLHIINENVCVYIINYILLQIRSYFFGLGKEFNMPT